MRQTWNLFLFRWCGRTKFQNMNYGQEEIDLEPQSNYQGRGKKVQLWFKWFYFSFFLFPVLGFFFFNLTWIIHWVLHVHYLVEHSWCKFHLSSVCIILFILYANWNEKDKAVTGNQIQKLLFACGGRPISVNCCFIVGWVTIFFLVLLIIIKNVFYN